MTGPRLAKYTCGNCYTEFDLPDDGRCPTCKVREIVPMGMSEMRDLQEDKDLIESRMERDLHIPTINEKLALHAIERAIDAEKEVTRLIAWHNRETQINIAEKKEIEQERDDLRKQLDGLVQAIYDFPVPDASKSSAIELIAWIESVCPWLEEVPNEQN